MKPDEAMVENKSSLFNVSSHNLLSTYSTRSQFDLDFAHITVWKFSNEKYNTTMRKQSHMHKLKPIKKYKNSTLKSHFDKYHFNNRTCNNAQ